MKTLIAVDSETGALIEIVTDGRKVLKMKLIEEMDMSTKEELMKLSKKYKKTIKGEESIKKS
jgi:hypothetical protein